MSATNTVNQKLVVNDKAQQTNIVTRKRAEICQALFCLAIGITIFTMIAVAIDCYQFGILHYQYSTTTDNGDEMIFSMQNSFECGINQGHIYCDNSVNAGNVNVYDICNLLASNNDNYKFIRTDINPMYDALNGAVFLVFILIGCNIVYILTSSIYKHRYSKSDNSSLKMWLITLLCNLLCTILGVYYGLKLCIGALALCLTGGM